MQAYRKWMKMGCIIQHILAIFEPFIQNYWSHDNSLVFHSHSEDVASGLMFRILTRSRHVSVCPGTWGRAVLPLRGPLSVLNDCDCVCLRWEQFLKAKLTRNKKWSPWCSCNNCFLSHYALHKLLSRLRIKDQVSIFYCHLITCYRWAMLSHGNAQKHGDFDSLFSFFFT